MVLQFKRFKIKVLAMPATLKCIYLGLSGSMIFITILGIPLLADISLYSLPLSSQAGLFRVPVSLLFSEDACSA